MGPGESLILFL